MPPLIKSPDSDRDPTSTAIARKLRELPSELPPPFGWGELQRRTGLHEAAQPPRSRVAPPSARRAVLLAAGFAAIVAAVVLVSRLVGFGNGLPQHGQAAVRPNTLRPGTSTDFRLAGDGRDSEQLLRRANAAERWLASEPDNEQVVQVSSYLAVSALEDRIASVDDQLSTERLSNGPPERVRALQLQRARMVDSLAQVRYAELLAAEVP